MKQAYWIDATARTITAVSYDGLADLQRMVGGYIEFARDFDTGDVLFVDEEGLLKGLTAFFRLAGMDRPFAGNGVLVGPEDDDGKAQAPKMPIELLARLIRFPAPAAIAAWAKGNSSEPEVVVQFGDEAPVIIATVGDLFGHKPGDKS